MLFNANNALTIDDPKHDLFAAIDDAIEAVENGLLYPDGTNDALSRNPGIENALARIDHLIEHVGKEHTKIGAMSNSLTYAVERSETLKLNVQTLRSDVLDTDIGEATMKLNQLSLNYQAMMASIARVQNLSLVNYL
jgi:flagellar hook-associated protein 3 FlgL